MIRLVAVLLLVSLSIHADACRFTGMTNYDGRLAIQADATQVDDLLLRELQRRLDVPATLNSITHGYEDADMPKFIEMDRTITLAAQLKDEGGPVVLVNTFVVPPQDADRLLATWSADAAIMKRQPGFISTQLHRGIAGSGVFLNYAVWESVAHFRTAFANPAFQARLADYPERTMVSPHLFRLLAVPDICVA